MRDANDRGYECLLLSDCCAVSAGSLGSIAADRDLGCGSALAWNTRL